MNPPTYPFEETSFMDAPTECFLTCSYWRFLVDQLKFKLEKLLGYRNMRKKLEKISINLYLCFVWFIKVTSWWRLDRIPSDEIQQSKSKRKVNTQPDKFVWFWYIFWKSKVPWRSLGENIWWSSDIARPFQCNIIPYHAYDLMYSINHVGCNVNNYFELTCIKLPWDKCKHPEPE